MTIPLCPYFGKCGGCTAQHIEYSLQLEQKKAVLAEATGLSMIEMFAGKQYYYRNRMDFVFHPAGLGLRKKGQWQSIIDVEQCVISYPKLNLLLAQIRTEFKTSDIFNIHTHVGTFRYAVIRVTSIGDSSISFVINDNSQRKAEAME